MRIKPLYEFTDDLQRQALVRRHLEEQRGGKASGPIEGAYGEIYSVMLPPNHFPIRIAAKCPRITRFGDIMKARQGIQEALHELEKTHQLFSIPWINRFFDIQFIHGWPFILSQYRDGSLDDLIANPLLWSVQDRFATLIQITRALRLADLRGVSAHQDLKPANIFFDDLSRQSIPKDSRGIHFHILVGDFGMADAFKEFGRNNGSRPYMAPEQFSSDPIEPTILQRLDVFALGVIAYECFSDGYHPIGVTTSDVWPWRVGIARKWNRKEIWQAWATENDKVLPDTHNGLPFGLRELIQAALSPNPQDRPSLDEFEAALYASFDLFDSKTCSGVKMQIEHVEGLSSPSASWPHMDDRLMQLREFYSNI